MSGGRWNYSNDYLASDMFGEYPTYGEKGFSAYKEARRTNPLLDKQLSELVWDVFVVLHSCDWYRSGDICEEGYLEDVKYFKDKWLNKSAENLVKDEIDKSIDELKEDLYLSLNVKDDENGC